MRLNPFNAGDINVRRGGTGGGFPGGGGGKLGCGSIVVVLIGVFVFGMDPAQMLGTMEGMQQQAPTQQTQSAGAGSSTTEICNDNAYALEACNALASLNQTWEPVFKAANVAFSPPSLTFLQGGTENTGCGQASSAMGPFYCPADQGIYIDVSFYDQMHQEMGAGGDFARYYVIAHEYGHHIQTLTGISSYVRRQQQADPRSANQWQVRMELQADCYAGVWAGKNRNLIEPGDFEEGMTAANAIGDDTILRNAGRSVNQESFTHGSSAQRKQALRLGMESADDGQCDAIITG